MVLRPTYTMCLVKTCIYAWFMLMYSWTSRNCVLCDHLSGKTWNRWGIWQVSGKCREIDQNSGNVGKKSGHGFKRLLLTSSVGLCRLSIILLRMTWVTANWVGVLQRVGEFRGTWRVVTVCITCMFSLVSNYIPYLCISWSDIVALSCCKTWETVNIPYLCL